jgi:hypothetical protein
VKPGLLAPRNHRVSAALLLVSPLVIRRCRGPSALARSPWCSGCARRHCGDSDRVTWIETMLTLHPVLPMRAAIVAAAATAFGILALANLTSMPPRARVAQESQLRAPIAAPVAHSLVVLSRADSLTG